MSSALAPIVIGKHSLKLFTRIGGFDPSPTSLLLAANLPAMDGATVVDIGCGTGLQGLIAALSGAIEIHCTDIQLEDLELARVNFRANGLEERLTTHESDLVESLIGKMPRVDVALFNLPHYPGVLGDHPSGLQKGAIAEGDGAELIVRTLDRLPDMLRRDGKAYFTMASVTNWSRIQSVLDKFYRWSVQSSVWIPWRFFELEHQPAVDRLVASGHAYYRYENGVPFTEIWMIKAQLKDSA